MPTTLRGRPSAQQADRELAAGQEFLDQHRLPESLQQVPAVAQQLLRIQYLRSRRDSLAGPFGHGFGEQRVSQFNCRHIAQLLHQRESRGRQAGIPHEQLRHPFIETDRDDQRIGEGVGDLVGVQQGWYLRFAGPSVQALTDVKHQVPAISRRQPLDQLMHVADPIDGVAQLLQCGSQGVDGFRSVEFRRLLLAVSGCQIVRPQIVCQTDRQAAKVLCWTSLIRPHSVILFKPKAGRAWKRRGAENAEPRSPRSLRTLLFAPPPICRDFDDLGSWTAPALWRGSPDPAETADRRSPTRVLVRVQTIWGVGHEGTDRTDPSLRSDDRERKPAGQCGEELGSSLQAPSGTSEE